MNPYSITRDDNAIWSLTTPAVDTADGFAVISTHSTETEALEAMADALAADLDRLDTLNRTNVDACMGYKAQRDQYQRELDATREESSRYRDQRDDWQAEASRLAALVPGDADRLKKAAADLDTLRRLVAELPWSDIHAGDFHPQQGCPDVARFIQQAEALGVDSDRLREGLSRSYTVSGWISVHITIEVDEADSEEDAIDRAEQDISYYSVHVDGATVNDVETNGYDWDAEEA